MPKERHTSETIARTVLLRDLEQCTLPFSSCNCRCLVWQAFNQQFHRDDHNMMTHTLQRYLRVKGTRQEPIDCFLFKNAKPYCTQTHLSSETLNLSCIANRRFELDFKDEILALLCKAWSSNPNFIQHDQSGPKQSCNAKHIIKHLCLLEKSYEKRGCPESNSTF